MAVVRLISLWIGYMLIFIAGGSLVSIIAGEIDQRKVKTTGMGAIGFWIIPMFIFWLLCIVAAIIFLTLNLSLPRALNILIIFLPGVFLGSAAAFLAGPLWLSRHKK
jgi:hypothetical protein